MKQAIFHPGQAVQMATGYHLAGGTMLLVGTFGKVLEANQVSVSVDFSQATLDDSLANVQVLPEHLTAVSKQTHTDLTGHMDYVLATKGTQYLGLCQECSTLVDIGGK